MIRQQGRNEIYKNNIVISPKTKNLLSQYPQIKAEFEKQTEQTVDNEFKEFLTAYIRKKATEIEKEADKIEIHQTPAP